MTAFAAPVKAAADDEAEEGEDPLAAVVVPLEPPLALPVEDPVAVADAEATFPVLEDPPVAHALRPTVAAVYVWELAERAEEQTLFVP